MIIRILITLILSILSGIAYRCGGMSTDPSTNPKWIPIWLRKSWVRDWICPLFSIITLMLWFTPDSSWWVLSAVVVYGLMGMSFSTYWDWLFGFDNYWFHGFAIGLSIFPMVFVGLAWWVVLIQAILTAITMGLWCKFIGNDVKQEMGRGFLATIFRVIA
jgi:hypothetical protein